MVAGENNLAILVDNFYVFRNTSKFRFLCVRLIRDGYLRVNSIADMNRFYKTQPVITLRKSLRIYLGCGKANTNAEDHRSVCDPLFKWLCFTPLGIHVMREKIPGVPGMNYKICFCYCSSQRYPLRSQLVILKKD